jgi:hypothetical protein
VGWLPRCGIDFVVCAMTTQSVWLTLWPNLVPTLIESPAELIAELASLYFCPTTVGAPAFATPVARTIIDVGAMLANPAQKMILFTLTSPTCNHDHCGITPNHIVTKLRCENAKNPNEGYNRTLNR